RVRALHGLARGLGANMGTGGKDGFGAKVGSVGLGYRARPGGGGAAAGGGDPAGAGLLAPGDLPAARGRDGGDRSPGVHHAARRRQGRPRPDSRQAARASGARPVQGQGHQVRQRGGPPEGRQEGGSGGQVITKERRASRDIRHRRLRRVVGGLGGGGRV